MTDYIYCGSAPSEEPTVQVSQDFEYSVWMHKEVELYRRALLCNFSPPDPACKLQLKRERHDFGGYMEIIAVYPQYFDEEKAAAIGEWVTNVETGLAKWTDCKDEKIANEALALMFDYQNAKRAAERRNA